MSIILVAIVIAVFLWAVKSGQFDDLEGPAHSILYEEEEQLNDVDDKGEEKEKKARRLSVIRDATNLG